MKRIRNIILLLVLLMIVNENFLLAKKPSEILYGKVDKTAIAAIQIKKATDAFLDNDYDSTIVYLKKALDLYRKSTDKLNTVKVLSDISKVYINQGYYGKAKSYSEEALFLLENYNDTTKVDLYINLAVIYTYELNYDMARDYFVHGQKNIAKLKDSSLIARYHYEIADYLILQNKLDSAHEHLMEAEKILLNTNDNEQLPKVYTLFGTVFFQKNQFFIAEKYLNKALQLCENSSVNSLMIKPASLEGLILLSKGNANAAAKLFETIADDAERINLLPLTIRVYRNLQTLAAYNKNFVLAEKYMDTIINLEKKMVLNNVVCNVNQEKYLYHEIQEEAVETQISKVKVIVFATVIIAFVLLPFTIIKKIKKKRNKKDNGEKV